jgi:hypothetical protein
MASGPKPPVVTSRVTAVPQPMAKIASMDQAAQVERLPTMRLASSGGTTAHIWSV